eukprot:1861977-Pyramimonas_sp.AAC.1
MGIRWCRLTVDPPRGVPRADVRALVPESSPPIYRLSRVRRWGRWNRRTSPFTADRKHTVPRFVVSAVLIHELGTNSLANRASDWGSRDATTQEIESGFNETVRSCLWLCTYFKDTVVTSYASIAQSAAYTRGDTLPSIDFHELANVPGCISSPLYSAWATLTPSTSSGSPRTPRLANYSPSITASTPPPQLSLT